MPRTQATRSPEPRHKPAARSGHARARVLCVALALALTGCAGSQKAQETPAATVMALARALSDGKPEVAYELMSPAYKQRVSLAQWQKQISENPQEVSQACDQLSHLQAPGRDASVVRYGDDGELRLTKLDGRWLIDSDVATFYDQSTPRAALGAFVRAMEAKRYDVVMRLIPNADKEGMTSDRLEAAWSGEARDEVERLLIALHDHRDDPIELAADHATMPYGAHRRVQFVREDGVWKIEDPQ
jgi:bisphosphoglycerate-independent phosphoglycerate mutase (AlkP superfamily)